MSIPGIRIRANCHLSSANHVSYSLQQQPFRWEWGKNPSGATEFYGPMQVAEIDFNKVLAAYMISIGTQRIRKSSKSSVSIHYTF